MLPRAIGSLPPSSSSASTVFGSFGFGHADDRPIPANNGSKPELVVSLGGKVKHPQSTERNDPFSTNRAGLTAIANGWYGGMTSHRGRSHQMTV
jgi:hypothetical protein